MRAEHSSEKRTLLDKLKSSATGLAVEYRLATGQKTRRIYLDSTASTLELGVVRDVMARYQPHYSNTHTDVHFSAKLSTHEYEWAHKMVLDFVHADPRTHGCFFVGSGTTGAINRVARSMSKKRPDRDVVITTIMEHHSNDLPHRKHFGTVVHVPVQTTERGLGCADVERIEAALEEYGSRVNYVAVTGVSNVTGIVNPVHTIAGLAHRYGTLIMVDAAQMAAHVPIRMTGHDDPGRDLDIVCLSGHKVYAPRSPGVVITRRDLFSGIEPEEVGGGMVDDVHIDRYLPTEQFPDREEAGTPNIAGAIALATALCALEKVGMEFIFEEETALINYAIEKLVQIKEVVVYGATDTGECIRAGAVSFNVRGMHHSLTAAILNDYFNIAVRNACFCAHPYVREMIMDDLEEQMDDLSNDELEALAELHRGMVRASFGLYNDRNDVDALANALDHICENKAYYGAQYHQSESGGDFLHNTFEFNCGSIFAVRREVDRWFGGDMSTPSG